MATKKVYPFINAKMISDEKAYVNDVNVVFDAREVECYKYIPQEEFAKEEDQCVRVCFKSGRDMLLRLQLDQEMYPGDNVITAIDMVQYSHFWHDNEDSTPDEEEEED